MTLVRLRGLPEPQPFYKRILKASSVGSKISQYGRKGYMISHLSLPAARQQLNTKRNRKSRPC